MYNDIMYDDIMFDYSVKKHLYNRKSNFLSYDKDIIVLASENGHLDVVEKLLRKVEPSVYKNKAIGLASQYGHTDIIELLLKDNFGVENLGFCRFKYKFNFNCINISKCNNHKITTIYLLKNNLIAFLYFL